MTEQGYVPFKAQNIPKGKVSLNQVTQISKKKKKIKKKIIPNKSSFQSSQ